MKKVVSYAQNREDVIINAFLKGVEKGFYVDVGANHPVNHSVTKLFYDRGWSGINIDPLESVQTIVNKFRSRDINLQIGIGVKKSKMTLREYENAGLSTTNDEMKHHYEELGINTEYKEYQVDVETMKSVLDKHSPGHIHFMKIDVEGAEYEVIKSNDWKKHRPEILCIEANHIIKDWHSLLKKAGYIQAFNDGLNEYYVAQESKHRIEEFDFPTDLLIGKQVIVPHPIAREMQEQASLIRHLKKSQEALIRKSKTQAQVIRDQNIRINNGVGIKYHSYMLYRAVGRKIKRMLGRVK